LNNSKLYEPSDYICYHLVARSLTVLAI
jgi:hypothetical protein